MAYRRGRRRGTSLLWAALIIASLCVYALPRLGTFLLVSDEPSPADATFLSYGVSIRRAALDAAAQRLGGLSQSGHAVSMLRSLRRCD